LKIIPYENGGMNILKTKLSIVIISLIFSFLLVFLAAPTVLAAPANADNSKLIAEYTEAINSNPNDAVAYYNRGQQYLSSKLLDLALEDFSKAVSINPKYAAAYLGRASIYEKREQYDKGMDDCNQAIKLDPTYARAYTSRATIYSRTSQYDLAIEDCNKSIALYPKNAAPYFFKIISISKEASISRCH